MQCGARHEGAVSSRNHVSWRRNRPSVKCQCPRYLTGALPCRRRGARPADRPARPAMNRLRRPCSSPAAFPGRCPARGEPFSEDGRNGSRLSGHLRQFGNLCHAVGARPALQRPPFRRCARPPVRAAGTARLAAGFALPDGQNAPVRRGSGRFLPLAGGPGPGAVAQPSGFPCGEQAPNLEPGHVASKYVVARSVAKCLSDLRTVPVA